MFMIWLVPILFAIFSLYFARLLVNDYQRSPTYTNPARKAWLKLSIIFAVFSIGLIILYNVL